MSRLHEVTNTQRHIACTQCRKSKAKCDGRKPFCKRCGSGQAAWECSYPTVSVRRGRPRKRSTSNLPPNSLPSPPDTSSVCSGSRSGPDRQKSEESIPDASPLALLTSGMKLPHFFADEQSSGHGDSDTGDDSFSSMYQCLSNFTWPVTYPPTPDDETPPTEHNNGSTQLKSMPLLDMAVQSFQAKLEARVAQPDLLNLPREFDEMIFSVYFNSCQSTLRLFENRDHLSCLVDQSGHDALALKYAIYSHAVPSCSQFFSTTAVWNLDTVVTTGSSESEYAKYFYHLARVTLNQCDLEQKSVTPSLRTLQATVLIGLYELQHAEFGCAWLSASRASWLTEILQLHALDSEQEPSSANDEQLRETRRAFWAANSFGCFIMRGDRFADSGSVSIDEITTWLPHTQANDAHYTSLKIGDLYRRAAPRFLCTEEALCGTRMIGSRILSHVKYARRNKSSNNTEQQPYNFWTHQHQLEETLCYILNFTKTWTEPTESTDSSINSMLLDLHIKALLVTLREAKFAKMCLNGFSQAQIRCCEDALVQSALELSASVQICMLPNDSATGFTLSWVTYIALQSLLRHQRRQNLGSRNQQPDIADGTNHWLARACMGMDMGVSDLYNTMCHDSSSLGAIPDSAISVSLSPSAETLTDALVLDSLDALQLILRERSSRTPVAKFFLGQIEMEIGAGDDVLEKRVVGLFDLATQCP